MKHFNKNNPTRRWTEDEKYDFCKMENKWLKELPKNGIRKVGVAGVANDPLFSTGEDINLAFENDILSRKENWEFLCHICDFATNRKQTLTNHFAVHGIGERFKCDKCDKDAVFYRWVSTLRHKYGCQIIFRTSNVRLIL